MAKKKTVDLACHINEINIGADGRPTTELVASGNLASVLVAGVNIMMFALNGMERGEQLPLAMQIMGQLQRFAGINEEDDPEDVVNTHLVNLANTLRTKVTDDEVRVRDVNDCIKYLKAIKTETEAKQSD